MAIKRMVDYILYMAEDEKEYTILLETDTDYREAIAALNEQLEHTEELMTSIVRLVDSIAVYEEENGIEHDDTE